MTFPVTKINRIPFCSIGDILADRSRGKRCRFCVHFTQLSKERINSTHATHTCHS